MNKYRVKIIEKTEKIYIIDAKNPEEAEECFLEGFLEHVEVDPFPDVIDIEDITE